MKRLAAAAFCGMLAPLAFPEVARAQVDGPIAPDIVAAALWDGRKIVPFKSLDNPKMVKGGDADFIGDEEYVLGVTVNGESRAYPTRFAWWHHFINDRIGEVPFVVSYCSVCNTGIRWDRRVNGKTVSFDFYGLYNGVVVMCERETGTVFLQVEGRGVKGPLTGTRLLAQPLLDTTWGEWKKLHPQTLVMAPDGEFAKFYRPKGMAEMRGYDRFPAPFFRPSITRGDMRLPPFDKVLGVKRPGADIVGKGTQVRRAYPVKAILDAGVINDMLDGAPVAVLCTPDTLTAVALSRRVDGRTLTLEARKEGSGTAWYDKETGTRWDIEGRGTTGPLAGKVLERLECHLSQWYGWSAYYPDTTIFGRTDAAMPGNPFDDKPLPQNPR